MVSFRTVFAKRAMNIGFRYINTVILAREMYWKEKFAQMLAKKPQKPLSNQGILTSLGTSNKSYFYFLPEKYKTIDRIIRVTKPCQ